MIDNDTAGTRANTFFIQGMCVCHNRIRSRKNLIYEFPVLMAQSVTGRLSRVREKILLSREIRAYPFPMLYFSRQGPGIVQSSGM